MSPDQRLITSPLFFVQPARNGVIALDLLHNQRFKKIAPEVFALSSFFLNSSSVGDAVDAGHGSAAIAAAVEAGILVVEDHTLGGSVENSRRWEDNRWSRAAYLLFSQQDLMYLEASDMNGNQSALVMERRQIIRSYLDKEGYPPIRLANVCDDRLISLPRSCEYGDMALGMDALFLRRSARRFKEVSISLEAFSQIIYGATRNSRIASDSKISGDPYYLLNSFYSWLQVYVVVQGVEGLRRGTYQYDPEAHQLRCIAVDTSDDEIIKCIQYQNWIGGGGFCAFFVVQWDRYQWLYRHARAYVNLLIQLGEIGQELLQAVYTHGLAAWPTPAVHESNAAKLLQLNVCNEDAMYFFKAGPIGSV